MQKIVPCLWFDKNAEEAVSFYTSIFKSYKIGNINYYGKEGYEIHHMEEGTILTIEFELEGQKFLALNGGPVFKFNPSVSFFIGCNTKEEIDMLWSSLSEGGMILMPLDKYPFSERYGWLQDKYGLSWQIMLMDAEIKQKIIPTLMFVGDVCGKAEEAMNFYISVFNSSKVGDIFRYSKNMEPDKEGTIAHASFSIENQEFAAMDSAREHNFNFNEAVSFIINCETQEEIDDYWGKLSNDPKAEQCGWLKDKYGVSWQVVPKILNEILQNKEKSEKVMKELLQMKKLEIEKLNQAYNS